MPRSIIPATTASGDAVILEATPEPQARDGTRGRLLAQLEHNAMAALGLVRAGVSGLQSVSRLLDRAAQMLAQNKIVVDPAKARELQRAFTELVEHVQTRAYAEHALLQGSDQSRSHSTIRGSRPANCCSSSCLSSVQACLALKASPSPTSGR